MKHSLIMIFSLLSIFSGFAVPDNPNPASNQMRIKIGSNIFTATLYDNATATAFKGMLPLTIKMCDLNGNEKYFDLSVNLPTNASNPGKIQSGDLMIYGSNTLCFSIKHSLHPTAIQGSDASMILRGLPPQLVSECNGYL